MIIALSLLVCIIGLVIFMATKNTPDLKEVGRIMFWTGLLAFMLVGLGPFVTLLGTHYH